MESSSFLTDSFEGICPDFTDLTELSNEGYCRLLRAKRYGRWYVLKTLKGDNVQLTPYQPVQVQRPSARLLRHREKPHTDSRFIKQVKA